MIICGETGQPCAKPAHVCVERCDLKTQRERREHPMTNPTSELRRVAEAASSGPWDVVAYGDGDSLAIHEGRDWRVCFMATPGETMGALERIEANAEHIATFDPPTVLSLISRTERAEAALQSEREARERAEAERDDALASVEKWMSAFETVRQRADTLEAALSEVMAALDASRGVGDFPDFEAWETKARSALKGPGR